ncbi:hypothetical protein B0H10DRAFT_1954874 [Mycena sp. CBHHK59/15]|nr:hypothetical protein B0H10DRAFT_1954874 [Mycena sp. CBHHK59/15]
MVVKSGPVFVSESGTFSTNGMGTKSGVITSRLVEPLQRAGKIWVLSQQRLKLHHHIAHVCAWSAETSIWSLVKLMGRAPTLAMAFATADVLGAYETKEENKGVRMNTGEMIGVSVFGPKTKPTTYNGRSLVKYCQVKLFAFKKSNQYSLRNKDNCQKRLVWRLTRMLAPTGVVSEDPPGFLKAVSK